jgi:hypothetical protein
MGWYHDPDFKFEDDAPASSSAPADTNTGTNTGTNTDTNTDTTSATPSGNTACPLPPGGSPPPPPPDVQHIYHLAQKSKWQMSKAKKEPYFPPTYMKDGKFTRATVHKSDLVPTANEFYKDTSADFIVLELNCSVLYNLGIPIMAQDAPESIEKQVVKCLQVFGGISTTLPGLVNKIYGMKRDTDGTFMELVEPAAPKKKKSDGDCGCCASGSCPPKEEQVKKSVAPREQARKTKTATPPPAKEKKGWFSRKNKA